ncbi:hypothetical protein D9Q98_001113 [Chlorella vulgaris]|uniref:Coenzyme Q-binding protein COQ10 START domain-containing protein n=1 Tax=Chlorella vulgaris TaxID=3077 RepID=A0A9D4TZP6_CHLVU|nr:hypothetical protein D9Q98_001113 [Chlorella vulgaris]
MSLRSFPVDSVEEDAEQTDVEEDVEAEIHRDEDVSIRVTQSPGFLCHIEATAAFRMPAEVLYRQVITHPDNAAIFRHMDRCSYRKVLSDDGQGRRRVRVAHEASWRFLLFHGTFTTKLDVEEDDRALTMDFTLDPSGGGVMKRFHGRWTIRPHPKDPEHSSLSTLDQDVALNVSLPPPLDRILKRISCRQVRNIFEDVKKEADKVSRGKPTLCPWEQARHKQIGVAEEEQAAGGQDGELLSAPAAGQHSASAAAPSRPAENGAAAAGAGAGQGHADAAAAASKALAGLDLKQST